MSPRLAKFEALKVHPWYKPYTERRRKNENYNFNIGTQYDGKLLLVSLLSVSRRCKEEKMNRKLIDIITEFVRETERWTGRKPAGIILPKELQSTLIADIELRDADAMKVLYVGVPIQVNGLDLIWE